MKWHTFRSGKEGCNFEGIVRCTHFHHDFLEGEKLASSSIDIVLVNLNKMNEPAFSIKLCY